MSDLGKLTSGGLPQNQEDRNLLIVAQGSANQEAERRLEEERRLHKSIVPPGRYPVPEPPIRWGKAIFRVAIVALVVVLTVVVVLFLIFVGDQIGLYHFPPTSK